MKKLSTVDPETGEVAGIIDMLRSRDSSRVGSRPGGGDSGGGSV